MKLLTLSLFSLALFGFSVCNADTPGYELIKEEIRTALKKFVEIVEENEMNVTFITSHVNHWSDNQVKEVKEYSICFPPYNGQPTESKITDEKVQDWMNTINNLQGLAGAIGRSRTAHIEDGKTNKVERTSTEENQSLFDTRLYKTITSVENGEQGFTVDNPSYQKHYNVYVTGADGKEERTEIIAGYVETEIEKKSEAMTEDEVNEIEMKLRETWMKYDSEIAMGRVIKNHMKDKFEGNDWQVIMDPGTEFYVPSKKYALVRAANVEALVYSM